METCSIFPNKAVAFEATHWTPAGSGARGGWAGAAGLGCGAGGEGCLGLAAAL